jgi:hypothetical protein
MQVHIRSLQTELLIFWHLSSLEQLEPISVRIEIKHLATKYVCLRTQTKTHALCEISGSHGDEYEHGCFLGCCAV